MRILKSSKVQSLAAAIRTYETALTRYFTDVGSLYPLNVTGVPTAETTGNSTVATSLPARLTLNASDPLNTGANQWRRFRGPYLERFDSANPPGIGTSMFMPATTPVSYGTSVTTTNFGWDLDAKDGLSDIPTGHTVVYLRITGIRQRDFLHLNNILDGGSSLARSQPKLVVVTGVPTAETTGNSTVATSLPARLTLNASDPLNTGANQWRRFRGPYLERFDSANPPGIGTSMFMPATTPVSYGTSVTTTNFGWDLDAKDGLSDIPTGHTVVYLRITGIRQRDFLHLNNILDGGSSLARSNSPQLDTAQPPVLASLVAGGGGGPPPPANTLTRGRLKYNVATQTALIYLAHSP